MLLIEVIVRVYPRVKPTHEMQEKKKLANKLEQKVRGFFKQVQSQSEHASKLGVVKQGQ